MANTTLHTLASRNANTNGVRVTGLDCNGVASAFGQPRLLSLLWQALPGSIPARPDVGLAEDPARTANAVVRAGRSFAFAGVLPMPFSFGSYRPTSRFEKRMRRAVQG